MPWAARPAISTAGIESGLTVDPVEHQVPVPRRACRRTGEQARGRCIALTDLELASRLSFFLWSEGPDQALLVELAAAGTLHQPPVLAAQVHRMLGDPRSASLITNFAFQWLNIPKIDTIEPDPVLYPDFTPDLRAAFREEMRLFLDSVLRSDRSVLELLSSDDTFLNETLARQYGVPDIRGDQFREVRLTDPNRWGLLGKGAVLMATSYGNRTAPVLRGAWILDNITGTPPTSPPPGVGALKETEPGKEAADRARAAGATPPESLLQCLPRHHGSAGIRAGELRCRRRAGATRIAMPAAPSTPAANWPNGTQVERPGAAAQGATRAARPVRADPHRETHDLRARAGP